MHESVAPTQDAKCIASTNIADNQQRQRDNMPEAFRQPDRILISITLGAILVISVIVPRVPKIDLCAFHRITGLPCAGCGMTRSFIAMGHGRIREAFAWHPMGPVLFTTCAILFLIFTCEAVTKRSWVRWSRKHIIVLAIIYIICMLLVWCIRISFIIYGRWLPIPIYTRL